MSGISPVDVRVQSLAIAGISAAAIVKAAAKVLRMLIANSLSHVGRVQWFLY